MRSQALLLAVVACAVYFGEVDLTARAQGSAANPLWPNSIVVNGANVTVYQPQAIEWPDHQRLTTREAIAITLPGEKAPVLGTTEISFATETDAATNNVILSNPQLLASHFPSLDTAQAARIEQQIKAALPDVHARPVPLESVILSLKQQAQPENAELQQRSSGYLF